MILLQLFQQAGRYSFVGDEHIPSVKVLRLMSSLYFLHIEVKFVRRT